MFTSISQARRSEVAVNWDQAQGRECTEKALEHSVVEGKAVPAWGHSSEARAGRGRHLDDCLGRSATAPVSSEEQPLAQRRQQRPRRQREPRAGPLCENRGHGRLRGHSLGTQEAAEHRMRRSQGGSFSGAGRVGARKWKEGQRCAGGGLRLPELCDLGVNTGYREASRVKLWLLKAS